MGESGWYEQIYIGYCNAQGENMDQTKIFGRILTVNLTDHRFKFLRNAKKDNGLIAVR